MAHNKDKEHEKYREEKVSQTEKHSILQSSNPMAGRKLEKRAHSEKDDIQVGMGQELNRK
jgi:hypothetical protein